MKQLLVLLFISSFSFGQAEDPEQYDQQIKYNSLADLCGCTSYVEALAVLNDIKPSVVKADINLYVVNYIETIKFAGYNYDPNEDILNKKVYFNKSGYIIPYDCVLSMLTGNKTDVKVVGDDEYHRVYHYEITD
jgi:hypothetical protein